MIEPPDPEAIVFRTLAAPGLDEDDIFAAIFDLPEGGFVWGDGMPAPVVADCPADPVIERKRRHDAVLDRWQPID